MSDNYLRLVPRDPNWHPDPEAAAASLLAMRDLLPAAECVTAESKDAVTFFDAGANATCIACPSCTADLLGWWGDAMGRAWDTGFEDLMTVTPCCQVPVSLNDLIYDWPQAFGRFALSARNPGTRTLSDGQLLRIELKLGSPLKVIWQHV